MPRSTWILPLCMLCVASVAYASISYPYSTLDGTQPLVIARGGASSFFPDMTTPAFSLAIDQGADFLLCGVTLTKDGKGFCSPSITLGNSTTVNSIITEKDFNTFDINGQSISGVFSPTFNYSTLKTLQAIQSNGLRPISFNGLFEVLDPYEATAIALNSNKGIYLELFSPTFFSSQGLNISDYILNYLTLLELNDRSAPVIISTSDIATLQFLRKNTNVYLVFKILSPELIEESTQTPFSKLTTDSSFSSIKSFADGISLSKEYIFTQDGKYISTTTDVVSRAHKAGLYVIASEFNNDANDFSWQWQGDPVVEILNYLPVTDETDLELGSIDGIISDFPATAAEALECYYPFDSLLERPKGTPLIIGESNGELPPQSLESFQTATAEGVDVLFCNVQLSSDAVPFCRNQANLDSNTNTLAITSLPSLSYPEIDSEEGRFIFDYNSSFILSLQATQLSAFRNVDLFGTIVTLETFFEVGINYTLKNITFLIDLQYADFLKSKKNLDMVDAVGRVLTKYSTELELHTVHIQSFEKGVLQDFKQNFSFPIIQRIDFCQKWNDDIVDISTTCLDSSSNLTYIDHISDEGLDAISEYADGISVLKQLIVPLSNVIFSRLDSYYLLKTIDLVQRAKARGLKVYVYNFLNEPAILEWDYYGDPTVQANFWVTNFELDGLFTSYPLTIANYLASRCYKSIAPDSSSAFSPSPSPAFSPSPSPSPSASTPSADSPSSTSASSKFYVPPVDPGYYLSVVRQLNGLSDAPPSPPPPFAFPPPLLPAPSETQDTTPPAPPPPPSSAPSPPSPALASPSPAPPRRHLSCHVFLALLGVYLGHFIILLM